MNVFLQNKSASLHFCCRVHNFEHVYVRMKRSHNEIRQWYNIRRFHAHYKCSQVDLTYPRTLRVHLYRDFSPHGRKIGCHFWSFSAFQDFSYVVNTVIIIVWMIFLVFRNDTEPISSHFICWKLTQKLPKVRNKSSKTSFFDDFRRFLMVFELQSRVSKLFSGFWLLQLPSYVTPKRSPTVPLCPPHVPLIVSVIFGVIFMVFGCFRRFWSSKVGFQDLKSFFFGSITVWTVKYIISNNNLVENKVKTLKNSKWQEMTSDFPPVRTEVTVQVYP